MKYISSFTKYKMLPKKDLTITPEKLYNLIINIIDDNINSYNYNEQFIKLLNKLKKDFDYELKKTYNWKTVMLSHKTCDHLFTNNSKHNGEICGRRIDIKTEGDNYLCSIHVEKSKHIPKKRNIEDSLRCPGMNMNGDRCGLKKKQKYNGYCIYHYKNTKIDTENKKKRNINLKNYVNDMILYHIDTDFIYEKYFNKKEISINNIVSNSSDDILESRQNNDLYKKNKYIDILKNVNKTITNINNDLYQLNIKKMTVKDCLNGGVKIINDKEYLMDISIYDIQNGKKINTTKLIDYYKKINKIKMYIENNKKYIYLKNNNNSREFYIKEKYINMLLEYINLRYNKLYESLPDYEPEYWIYLLNEYKLDVDSIITDFYDMDDKEKIYI